MIKILNSILIGLILTSCTQSKNVDQSIFDSEIRIVKISNSNLTEIDLRNGARLIIPANSFQTNSDKDSIDLFINEVNDVSDILKNNLTTTTKSSILQTRHMFNLRAQQDDQEIKLLNGKRIFYQNNIGQEYLNYRVFYGQRNNKSFYWKPDTIGNYKLYMNYISPYPFECWNCDYAIDTVTFDTLYWDKDFIDIDTLVIFTNPLDTIRLQDYYIPSEAIESVGLYGLYNISIRQLGWINIDKFLSFSNTLKFRVKIPNAYQRIYCYAILNNYRSVLSSSAINKNEHEFGPLPKNEPITIVAIAQSDSNYYFEKIQLNMINGELIKLDLQKMEREIIEKELNKLNQ